MSNSSATRRLIVTNPAGLHARPADLLSRVAQSFSARVEIVKDGERVDAKSIIHLLMLGAVEGTELVVEADGPDAEAAVEAVEDLMRSNFGESADSAASPE